MIVTGWTNGSGAYGVRIGKPNVRKHFHKPRREIDVLVGGHVQTYRLTDTFWTTCPELRGGRVGQWLKKEGLVPWPRGKPPKLQLAKDELGRYRLSR